MNTGLLIITHGGIGEAMLDAARFILDEPLNGVQCVPFVSNGDNAEDSDCLRRIIQDCDQGQGVLVLTDLPGASPSNRACEAIAETRSKLVSGLNLPMLLRAWNYRQKPVEELAALAADGGKQAIGDQGG